MQLIIHPLSVLGVDTDLLWMFLSQWDRGFGHKGDPWDPCSATGHPPGEGEILAADAQMNNLMLLHHWGHSRREEQGLAGKGWGALIWGGEILGSSLESC